jgi:Zn-dependent protease with chaperone function
MVWGCILLVLGLFPLPAASRRDPLAIQRWLGLVTSAPDRLTRAVDAVSQRMQVPLKSVEVLRWHVPNAFAFPLARRVVFTDAALDALDDDQIEAVATHELAHLAEPAWALAIRLIGPNLMFSSPVLVIAALRSHFEPGISALVILPVLVALLLPYRWFSRRMEERADRMVREVAPDPRVYATALERIHERGLVPVVRGARGEAHPDLYDRMLAAGQEPDYPRPKPARSHIVAATLFLTLAALPPIFLRFHLDSIADWVGDESGYLTELALTGSGARELSLAAIDALAAQDVARAVVLQRAAASIDDDDPEAALDLAQYLIAAVRCDEAASAADEARSRLAGDYCEGCPPDDHLKMRVQVVATMVEYCRASAPRQK